MCWRASRTDCRRHLMSLASCQSGPSALGAPFLTLVSRDVDANRFILNQQEGRSRRRPRFYLVVTSRTSPFYDNFATVCRPGNRLHQRAVGSNEAPRLPILSGLSRGKAAGFRRSGAMQGLIRCGLDTETSIFQLRGGKYHGGALLVGRHPRHLALPPRRYAGAVRR